MKLTELPQERLEDIHGAWQATAPSMFDEDRTFEAMCMRIAAEPTTHWYVVGDGYLILRNVTNGQAQAVFLTKSGEVYPKGTADALRGAMRELGLRRLFLLAPSAISWREYKLLGFQHEGRLRKALLFNGDWSDVEVMGALDTEVGVPKRKFRPRRRKNGKRHS